MIGAGFAAGLQLVEHGDFAVSGGSANDGFNFTGVVVLEHGTENVVLRHDVFECRLNDFDRSRGEDVEIKFIAIDLIGENLVEQVDVVFQANAFSDFVEMLAANSSAEFGIVQQQVGELRPLLDEVQFLHPFNFAFELGNGNAHHFTEDVAGVVEGQRLIKVTGENIAF